MIFCKCLHLEILTERPILLGCGMPAGITPPNTNPCLFWKFHTLLSLKPVFFQTCCDFMDLSLRIPLSNFVDFSMASYCNQDFLSDLIFTMSFSKELSQKYLLELTLLMCINICFSLKVFCLCEAVDEGDWKSKYANRRSSLHKQRMYIQNTRMKRG